MKFSKEMSENEQAMLDRIKRTARKVMPSGTRVFLYGSRARGDAHEGSDWDILILVSGYPDGDEISTYLTNHLKIGLR